MRLIDADKFLEYLIFSKHIDSLTCKEVKEAVKMCKVDVLEQIRQEIQRLRGCSCYCSDGIIDDVEDIIDRYIGK